jgi:tetratricopeptide (TPR) repeat protein
MLRTYFEKYLGNRHKYHPDEITKEIITEVSGNRLAYLFNLRGNAYLTLGKYDAAIKDFNTAIGWNSRSSQAYKDRGDAYLAMGLFSKALDDYNQALNCNYHVFIDVYCNRGHAYYELGKLSHTIADYTRSLTVNERSHAGSYLENILLNFKRGELDSVPKQDLVDAIKKLPQDKQIQLLRLCLNAQHPLGARMWKTEFPYTGCSYSKSTLKNICDYLDKIDPTFINPASSITQQSIFKDNRIVTKDLGLNMESDEHRYQQKIY